MISCLTRSRQNLKYLSIPRALRVCMCLLILSSVRTPGRTQSHSHIVQTTSMKLHVNCPPNLMFHHKLPVLFVCFVCISLVETLTKMRGLTEKDCVASWCCIKCSSANQGTMMGSKSDTVRHHYTGFCWKAVDTAI